MRRRCLFLEKLSRAEDFSFERWRQFKIFKIQFFGITIRDIFNYYMDIWRIKFSIEISRRTVTAFKFYE